MHLFCPACGKHIDVSIEEIENLQGHLVCPQCLESIDVDVPDKELGCDVPMPGLTDAAIEASDSVARQEQPAARQEQPAAPQAELSQVAPPPMPKPQQQPQQPQHVDSVLRYCKRCGAFLREGANFCPKCGTFVKVVPTPRRTAAATPPPYRTPTPSYQPSTPRNMASTTRKPTIRKNKKAGESSKFSIYTPGGCFIITIIAVAIFFIAYIVMGINLEG